MYTNGDEILIDSQHRNVVLNALKNNESLIFRIVDAGRPTTSFLFTLKQITSQIYLLDLMRDS